MITGEGSWVWSKILSLHRVIASPDITNHFIRPELHHEEITNSPDDPVNEGASI
jgi:hypothetical protein